MQGYTRKKKLALCDRTLENFDRPRNDTNVLCELLFLPTSHPSEEARMARRQQNRAAQDWAIGRKILVRAEKSVT